MRARALTHTHTHNNNNNNNLLTKVREWEISNEDNLSDLNTQLEEEELKHKTLTIQTRGQVYNKRGKTSHI